LPTLRNRASDRQPRVGLYLSADADCAGLPKTLRHASLKLARCRRMQAVIRSTSGISDEQSRSTSGVHSRRWSSCVNARLAEGHNAPDAAMPATSNNPRTQTICRIVPSFGLTGVAVIIQAVHHLGIDA
jgi:hypothetical protein